MSPREREMLRAFRALSEGRQDSLLDYAVFLASRPNEVGSTVEPPAQTPLDMPRPAEESVVKAIRRLTATYPMLERNALLNETSAFMTQHIMHKRPAVEVIDDLEILFRRHYEVHIQDSAASKAPPSGGEAGAA